MIDYDDFIIPDFPVPFDVFYGLCWKSWFDNFDCDIQNPCPVGDKTDTINLHRDDEE